ncbi:hypothetical protein BUGL105410_27765 [Burkholderia gladioli]
MAIRLQRQIACLRRDRPCVRDTDACRVANQKHPVGIHATQLGHINRDSGNRTVTGDRRRGKRVVIDLVRAGDHVQILRVDRRIGLHGTRNDVDLIEIRGIEARPGNGHEATVDVVASQRAVGSVERHARGQGRAACVDEARAIEIDTRGIRQHKLRAGAGDLQRAADLGGVRAVDLVDDDARRIVRPEVRVAVDPSAKLGLDHRGRVVQDRAGLLHVELVVGVDRHTATTGLVDIDLRQPVRRLDHHRRARPHPNDLRLDRRRQSAGHRRGGQYRGSTHA